MKQAPLVWVLGALILVGCGSEPGPQAAPDGAAASVLGPSVVFGPVEMPSGGTLHVGLLVPAPLSSRLVDLLPAGVYSQFLAAEEARAADADDQEPVEEEVFEWEHESEVDAWREARAGRQEAAAAALKELGVRVVFHHVLPIECAALPLVLVEDAPLYPNEVAILAAYQERGGRVLREQRAASDVGTPRPGVVPVKGGDHRVFLAACREAIQTSVLVHRMPVDPLGLVAAERKGTEVRVHLRRAPTHAVLRNLSNEEVARVHPADDGVLSVVCPDPGVDPYTHRLVATWQQGDVVLRRAWRIVDLVGTLERRVFATRSVEAGATYAPRVTFTNTRTGEPVQGIEEHLVLAQGERTLAEATGRSGPAGSLDLVLAVPADANPGPAVLQVGRESFPVEIRRGTRVSIVTDRTLYRAEDEVRVRLMVHTAALGRPVPGREVVLKHGSVEKRVQTSDHGIASATFALVGARLGRHTLTASVDGASATARFDVRAFERPTFLLSVEPARLMLRRGDEAPVVLTATHVNGSPMASMLVSSKSSRTLRHADIGGRTDERGRLEVIVKAGPNARSGYLTLNVSSPEGRVEHAKVWVEVERPVVRTRLDITPLEDPVRGRPCRFEVTSSKPGAFVLDVAGEEQRTVWVDATGRATVEITPRRGALALRVMATAGPAVEHSFPVYEPGDDEAVLRLAKRVWRVGETLVVTVRAPDGPVYVDLLRDRTVLHGVSAVAADGKATLHVPLTPGLAGRVAIHAWRAVDEKPHGSGLTCLVLRDRRLGLEAQTERESYRPGETAYVDVSVHDRRGEPTAAVLGYWGVDEALLALAPWSDGREEVFDALGPTAQAPLASLAADAERGRDAPFPASRAALGSYRGSYGLRTLLAVRHRDGPPREKACAEATQARFDAWFEGLQQAYVEAFRRMSIEELRTASSLREVVLGAVRAGHLDPRALVDPWGTPLDLGHGWGRRMRKTSGFAWEYGPVGVPCRSAGPDLAIGSADDPRAFWQPPTADAIGGRLGRFLQLCGEHAHVGRLGLAPFWGPSTNSTIGIGGGAGSAFSGRGGSRDLGTAGGGRKNWEAPVHVRKDFAPTLCFVPEVIVGPEGTARLAIPLKDSITTWGLRLVASDEGGATGVGFGRIRVSQPLHVQPWLATHLTVGDELELPVALRNETKEALTVVLTLVVSAELAPVGATEAVVAVPAGGTGAHRFRFRAVARGDGRVRLDAASDRHRDAVERVVHVRPHAREVVDVLHATLAPDRPWEASFPALAAGAPREYRLSAYASPLANLIGGLEGLLTCPHG